MARWFASAEPAPRATPPAASGSPQALLVRILGSDLAGTADDRCSLRVLRFILEHEPQHPGLHKRWLLNRIADPAQRQALILLLNRFGQDWEEIRFDASEYAACWSDLGNLPQELHPWSAEFDRLDPTQQLAIHDYIARSKHLYIRNRNAARLHALQSGLRQADWVLAWDGDCLLSAAAWASIRALLATPGLAYLVVPTAAQADPTGLLRAADLPPSPSDWLAPQFGFSRLARLHFDPQLREGPWVDDPLMKRLALARRWLEPSRAVCPWELIDLAPTLDADRLVQVGWTFRLSGQKDNAAVEAEPEPDRWLRQQKAIRLQAHAADMDLLSPSLETTALRCWTDLRRAESLSAALASIAARARALPPESVVDRAEFLPGTQEPNRRFRPLDSAWQFLSTPGDELPVLRCLLDDGDLPSSSPDDRSRLQRMTASVCCLALDGHINANQDSLAHACRLLAIWFSDPATALLPDGVDDAAVEFRDLYPLLDAIALLQRSGQLAGDQLEQVQEWFDGLLGWLVDTSGTLLREYSDGPGVTWHHLLILAIAAFRSRRSLIVQVFDNLPGLLAAQFRADGSPRATSVGAPLRHEDMFNLQAWSSLVVLCSSFGRDLWAFQDSNGHGLKLAFINARSHLRTPAEPGTQSVSRAPWLAAMESMCQSGFADQRVSRVPHLADLRTGLPPFWLLCTSLAKVRTTRQSESGDPASGFT